MYCEFYIDVFFVVNLLMDFLALCLTNQLLSGAAKPVRAFLGAVLGAGGACVLFLLFLRAKDFHFFISYGVLVFLMVRLGCGLKNFRRLLLGTGIFYGASFLFGGILTALPEAARKKIFTFSAITVTTYWMINIGIRLCKYLKGKRAVQCEVEIWLNGKNMKVKGLWDTGNCLLDQDTGKPVSVMDYNCFLALLDQREQKALEAFCSMKTMDTEDGQGMLCRMNPRFVLYTSVGCSRGLLPVVTADSLFLPEEGKRMVRAAIGLSKTALSPYGNFQIIISPTILDR